MAIVSSADFSWVEGKKFIKRWRKPNHDWETSFCSECGSPLPGKNDENFLYIPVSLLDTGYEGLKIEHHLFVDSKAPWEEVTSEAKKHKDNFGE